MISRFILILVVCGIFLITACSKEEDNIDEFPMYDELVTLDHQWFSNDICEAGLEKYLIASSQINEEMEGRNVSILKCNIYGEILWQKSVEYSGYSGARRIFPQSDGNFLVLISNQLDWNEYYLLKLTPDGEVLWNRQLDYIEPWTSFYVNSDFGLSDGSFIMIQHNYSSYGADKIRYIYHIDTEGNLINQRSWVNDDIGNLNSAYLNSNDELFILWSGGEAPEYELPWNVMKINSGLDIEWTRGLPNSQLGYERIIALDNGDYFLEVWHNDQGEYYSDFTHYSSDGTEMPRSEPFSDRVESVKSIHATSDNELIIIGGQIWSGGYVIDPIIVRYNADSGFGGRWLLDGTGTVEVWGARLLENGDLLLDCMVEGNIAFYHIKNESM